MAMEKPKTQVTKLQGILMLLAAIGLCGVMWWNISSGSSEGNTTQAPAQDQDSAGRVQSYTECRNAVSDQLLTPTEADFASLILGDAKVEKRSDGTFFVRSFVDTSNAFDAQVRIHFTCTVATDGNDTWKVVDLTIQE